MEKEKFTLEYYMEKDEQKKAKARAYAKNYYEKNKQEISFKNKQKRTGITDQEYEKLLKDQDGFCALCGTKQETLCIDHCHETDKIRGLLCHRCNMGIGFFNDDPILLKEAIRYLST